MGRACRFGFEEKEAAPTGEVRVIRLRNRCSSSFSIYRLAHDGIGVCVERPQHNANATRTYRSLQKAKSALLSFGIAEEVLDECLKLVPQLGEGERLKLPPLDVPRHDLMAAGFGTLELGVTR